MSANNGNTPDESKCDFVISRVLDAPRALVYRAWTDPVQMAQWWGPHAMSNPVCELDVRVGGRYRLVMRGLDGNEYPCTGVYREIVEPERLVMTLDCSEHPEAWHDMVNPRRDKSRKPRLEALQTVTFEELDGRTKLTIRTRFESEEIRNSMLTLGMTEGWSQSLEKLTTVLATVSVQPVVVRVTRAFAATPDEVFRAWLDPECIGRWMFGPALRDEEVLHLHVDPRVGGKFSFLVRRQGNEVDHVGTYRVIDPPRRLVFTWGIAGQSEEASLVKIDITPLANGCELTLTHEMHPRWAEYAARTEAGWTKMLAALAATHGMEG